MLKSIIQIAWQGHVLRSGCVYFVLSLLLAVGCSSDSKRHVESSDDAGQVDIAADSTSSREVGGASSENCILAGYGIDTCHVGMAIGELGSEWQDAPEPDLMNEMKLNHAAGMDCSHDGLTVTNVDFYFFGSRIHPFGGTVQHDISSRSTLEDIKEAFGEPSYIITKSRSDFGDFPGTTEVIVDYVELGIQFSFIDDKLFVVSVRAPNTEFDYEGFENAMGDAITFIRRKRDSE